MQKETIIQKGKYLYQTPNELVELKQYIFTRGEDGKKRLYLRFVNNKNAKLDAISFVVYRLNAKGNVIGEEKYDSTDMEIKEGAYFGYEKKIPVEEKCTDFRVKILSATYGDYTYHVENKEISVSYRDPDTLVSERDTEVKSIPRQVRARTFEMPWIFVIVSLIILALGIATIAYTLKSFMSSEDEFTLNGVEYEFVTDKNNPQVYITGCSGRYENILIPAEIEGYRVIGIKKGAFVGNETIKKLKIESVPIEEGAFENCKVLESIELINVEKIGKESFNGCDELSHVVIKNAKSIGQKAFEGCKKLITVNITHQNETTPLTIGEDAFARCTLLRDVAIKQLIMYPENISIFKDSNRIKTLYLKNFAFTIPEKYTYDERNNHLAILFGASKGRTNNYILESLTIELCDTIGSQFLFGFKSVKNVKIGKLEVPEIGSFAFAGCMRLEKLETNEKITKVGESAFYDSGLLSFDASRVTEIMPSAFESCRDLRTVKMSKAGECKSIGVKAFFNCESLEEIVIPQQIDEIREKAFEGCTSLKSVTFSDEAKLVKIDKSAFFACNSLEKIIIPEGTEHIGERAFEACDSLVQVVIPKSVTRVDDLAFADSGLKVFNLAETITTVGFNILKGCNKLEELTIHEIPDGGVVSLFDTPKADTIEEYKRCIPQSIKKVTLTKGTYIPDSAFMGFAGTKEFVLPDSLISIGRSAFAYCSALETIELSSELKTIGSFAFEATGIKNIVLPDSLQGVGLGAFKDCNSLKEITVPFIGEGSEASYSFMAYIFGAQNIDEIIGDESAEGEEQAPSVVPAALEKITVTGEITSLPEYAFCGCVGVKSFELSENITKLGRYSFYGCQALKSISLSKITEIDSYALAKTGILIVDLPEAITEISEGVFKGCTSLTKVKYGGEVTKIGKSAFEKCEGLKSIAIPNTVVEIGEYALAGTSITQIEIPSTVTTLGRGVLSGCSYIETIVAPVTLYSTFGEMFSDAASAPGSIVSKTVKSVTINSTQNISANFFEECTSIEEIIVGEGIEKVGSYAFSNCSQLKYLSLPSTLTSLSASSTNECIRLYEITNNSSSVSISAGSYTAPYAYVVNASDDERAPYQDISGMRFACYDGKWYLIGYTAGQSDITLPDSVGENGSYGIAHHVFLGDKLLKRIIIPKALNYLGQRVFAETELLEEVSIAKDATLNKLPEYTFSFCLALKRVVLPSSITEIGYCAFYQSILLEEVVMPTALKTIGSEAFYDCSALNGIKLYESVNSIGIDAFYGCSGLYDVYNASSLGIKAGYYGFGNIARNAVVIHTNMDDEYSEEVKINGVGTFRRFKGDWLLLDGSGCGTSIDLSTLTYNGEAIVNLRIKEKAFIGNINIEYLIIGPSVTQIQASAFYGASSLVSVKINAPNLTEIEEYAFYDCSSLKTLELSEGLVTLGNSAFQNCYMLEGAKLPSTLTTIGKYAFKECSRLLSVTIGKNVNSIGTQAFSGCTLLFEVFDLSSSINITKGSTQNGYVGYYAKEVFTSQDGGLTRYNQKGCTFVYYGGTCYLYSGTGTNGLVDIHNYSNIVILSGAFANQSVSSIIMPYTIKEIQEGAFSNSSAITVYYKGNSTQWYNIDGYTYLDNDVLYYIDCIHGEEGVWTYKNGAPSTDSCILSWSITKDATCYDDGYKTGKCTCEGCLYYETEVIESLGHTFSGNSCKKCGATRYDVNMSNFNTLIESGAIVNDTTYQYTIDDTGTIASTNKEGSTKSTLKIVAIKKMNVSCKMISSCEAAFDTFTVYKNGEKVNQISGQEKAYSLEIVLEEGDYIEFTYSKNISDSMYDDCGYIKKLQLIY
ncbi:MAG: leucine-rich repeat domain-containing protein [Clostridia bacterium]|nr:leucine-rich repeat domain-containing protein [Clostridia bacterium]